MTQIIAAVTGLEAEARLLAPLGWRCEVGGGTPAGAGAAAERLVAGGATALISFGLAGGLDPAFRPGALVVPVAVVEEGESFRTDQRLSDLLGGWAGGMLYGGHRIVAGVADKKRLWETTMCGSIDLESGAVARVAARHGLPFAVLRAICDPADRDLPPAALEALDAGGGIRIARVAVSTIRNPRQIPDLIAVGRDAAWARKALVGRVHEILLRLR